MKKTYTKRLIKEVLLDNFTLEQALDEVLEAMSYKELEDNFDHICNMWDIKVEGR